MRTQRFHRLAAFVIVSLPFVFPVAAQAPRTATTTRHSLWKVEGKHNTVYLLGSVHFLKPSDYPLASTIESAFTNSPVVAFETDISAMEDSDAQLKLLSKAHLPEGETLAQQLSADVYADFTKQVEKAGLPAAMFDQFKPALAVMMVEALALKRMGLDPDHGLDKHFFDLARKAQKQIVSLESVDFQIGLLTDLTKAEGEGLTKSILKDLDKLATVLGDMMKAWQTGDSDALQKLLNEDMRDEPALYKRLVTDRNQRWVPKIEEMCRGDKNTIIIVGAGHLVGKEGVVELLKKKGLKVVQQ